MSQIYEVVIFTASLSFYASPLIDGIDPSRYASHRLYREHCLYCYNAYVKDIKRLGRNPKDIIIVDNSPNSYALQPENAIPILTWIDDMSDTQLIELIPVLELLSNFDDVRSEIKKITTDGLVNYFQAEKILKLELEKKNLHLKCWINPFIKEQDNALKLKEIEVNKKYIPSTSPFFSKERYIFL